MTDCAVKSHQVKVTHSAYVNTSWLDLAKVAHRELATMNVETPGEMIRRARQEARLTQAALASDLGVHKNTVADWEKGKYFPDRHWGALSKILRISLRPPGAAGLPPPDPLAQELGPDAAGRVRRELARRGEAGRIVLAEFERVLSSPGAAEEERSGPDRAVS